MFIIWCYLPRNSLCWNETAGTKSLIGFLFLSSAKCHERFSKMNDSVKLSLKKWVIYHPRVIQYSIVNYYITVGFDDGNGGVKTELHQKFLL